MSKNSVWNRGKHNGAGLSKKPPVNTEQESGSTEEIPAEPVQDEAVNARIDTVKPMNRSNWVTRPARTKPQKPGRKE